MPKVAKKLQSSLIETTIGQSSLQYMKFEEKMRKTYFNVVDLYASEFERRFSQNKILFELLESLDVDSVFFK